MFRSYRFMAAIAAVVCLWPTAAGAEGLAPSDSATEVRSVDQVRSAFSAAGYQVHQAYTWAWMVPPVTSFQVRDPANDRVVLVLVYNSSAAADAARLQAQALEPGVAGPHLVPGYGASLWSGNVAMVQTTARELEHADRIQTDRNNRLHFDQGIVADASASTVTVDLDFQEALQGSTASV